MGLSKEAELFFISLGHRIISTINCKLKNRNQERVLNALKLHPVKNVFLLNEDKILPEDW
jgi:hypothetical protein